MTKEEFLNIIQTLLIEQSWQDYKGRSIKSSLRNQRRCVNKLTKAMGFPKPDEAEIVHLLTVGEAYEGFVRESLFGKLETNVV